MVDDVGEVARQGGGGEGGGGGDDERFGEEVVVEVVACRRLLELRPGEEGEGFDPADRSDGRGRWGGEASEELRSDVAGERREGPDVRPGDGKAGAVEVDADSQIAIDDRRVLDKILNVCEGCGGGGGGGEHTRDAVLPIYDCGWGRSRLEVEGCDNAKGICGAAQGVKYVRVCG